MRSGPAITVFGEVAMMPASQPASWHSTANKSMILMDVSTCGFLLLANVGLLWDRRQPCPNLIALPSAQRPATLLVSCIQHNMQHANHSCPTSFCVVEFRRSKLPNLPQLQRHGWIRYCSRSPLVLSSYTGPICFPICGQIHQRAGRHHCHHERHQ